MTNRSLSYHMWISFITHSKDILSFERTLKGAGQTVNTDKILKTCKKLPISIQDYYYKTAHIHTLLTHYTIHYYIYSNGMDKMFD